MNNFINVMKALPTFSQKELTEIRTHCQFLLQQFRNDTKPIDNEDWLMLGFISELERLGLYVPVNIKNSQRSNAGYTTVSTEVRRLLELAAPGLDAVQKRSLGQIAAKALVDYIQSWRDPIELSLPNLLLHARQVPVAIDRAYPGYLEAQLLGLTVRA